MGRSYIPNKLYCVITSGYHALHSTNLIPLLAEATCPC